MSYTKNLIKNNSFYKIITFFIMTLFFSLQCYPAINSGFNTEEELVSNSIYPKAPPPSYTEVYANTNDILPTPPQELAIIKNNNIILTTPENTTAVTSIVDIQENNRLQNTNDSHKQYKKKILIKWMPCILLPTIVGILALLTLKKIIDLQAFLAVGIACLAVTFIYAIKIEPFLEERFLKNTN